MSMREEGYCLVLGGGGAKGVYHIGVWRALRELGIPVEAFIGASIGAIIAGFLAQGADEALEELGRTISVDNVLALPKELTENGAVKLDLEAVAGVPELLRGVIRNRGLDTNPLRRLIAAHLDEKAIREGGKDLGIVTVNLSDLKGSEVFIDDMPKGSVLDYLMASSAFPGFKQPQIDGKNFIDGGVYDNVPFSMARKRGYRRIIVSDISGAGWTRKPQIEGGITVYIKNSIDMGGVLDFDRDFLERFTLLGYLDTLRSCGKLVGYSYFLEPDPEAEAAHAIGTGIDAREFPERMCHDRRRLLVSLECAASILEVERVRRYTYGELAQAIATKREAVEKKIAEDLAAARLKSLSLATALGEAVRQRKFEECPYYYYRLVAEALPTSAGGMLEKALVGFYPELLPGAAWLAGHEGPRLPPL